MITKADRSWCDLRNSVHMGSSFTALLNRSPQHPGGGVQRPMRHSIWGPHDAVVRFRKQCRRAFDARVSIWTGARASLRRWTLQELCDSPAGIRCHSGSCRAHLRDPLSASGRSQPRTRAPTRHGVRLRTTRPGRSRCWKRLATRQVWPDGTWGGMPPQARKNEAACPQTRGDGRRAPPPGSPGAGGRTLTEDRYYTPGGWTQPTGDHCGHGVPLRTRGVQADGGSRSALAPAADEDRLSSRQ